MRAADQDSRALAPSLAGELAGQPRLANTRLSNEKDHPATPREGAVEPRAQRGQLLRPADEALGHAVRSALMGRALGGEREAAVSTAGDGVRGLGPTRRTFHARSPDPCKEGR